MRRGTTCAQAGVTDASAACSQTTESTGSKSTREEEEGLAANLDAPL